jgi:hypothetical protein
LGRTAGSGICRLSAAGSVISTAEPRRLLVALAMIREVATKSLGFTGHS